MMSAKPSGTLYVVATPIGNLQDITPRLTETLRSVDLLACEDTRTTMKLLQHLGLRVELTSLHDFNERQNVDKILQRLTRGQNVALLSEAGSPGISDPGWLLVEAALRASIRVIPIPGPSAITAALSVAGLPADEFIFLGFLPRQGKERQKRLQEIATSTRTSVVLESPLRVQQTLKDLRQWVEPTRRLTLGRELTKLHEEVRAGSLEELLAQPMRAQGEYTLVIAGADEKSRTEQIRQRWQLYRQHDFLQEAQIIELLAQDFEMNPKRLKYLLSDWKKNST